MHLQYRAKRKARTKYCQMKSINLKKKRPYSHILETDRARLEFHCHNIRQESKKNSPGYTGSGERAHRIGWLRAVWQKELFFRWL